MDASFALGILALLFEEERSRREAGETPGPGRRAAAGTRPGRHPRRSTQVELRAARRAADPRFRVARAAARRRVGAYTAAVATLGLALLVAVAPAAAKVAGQ